RSLPGRPPRVSRGLPAVPRSAACLRRTGARSRGAIHRAEATASLAGAGCRRRGEAAWVRYGVRPRPPTHPPPASPLSSALPASLPHAPLSGVALSAQLPARVTQGAAPCAEDGAGLAGVAALVLVSVVSLNLEAVRVSGDEADLEP